MPSPSPASPARKRTPIEARTLIFTGSGREYFHVWIVNLVLMVVTLALYTPFARRRTAQYFFSHTMVAGTPLEFTASALRMFMGFMVFVALYLLLKLAEFAHWHLLAALLMLGAMALIPFFWGSAMRFRLRATRWRGVRMAFTARWGEVYAASWPLLCLVVLWGLLLLPPWLGDVWGGEEMPLQTRLALYVMFRVQWPWVLAAGLVLGALVLCCLGVQEFNYRRLLVRRTRIGQQMGHWPRVGAGAFVRIWFVSALLAVVGVAVFYAVVLGVITLPRRGSFGSPGWLLGMMLTFAVLGVLTLLLGTAPAMAYHEASVFRLVWGGIGLGQVVRSRCSLSVRGFVWLRIRNTLLTIITLGFYRPYARAVEYRMKVESITFYVKGGLDQFEGRVVQEQGALGDAIADGLGLDIF